MRSLESARTSWQELKQIQTLRELKEAVRLDGSSSIATAGARSICWKVFLLFDTLDVAVWTRTLSSSRLAYNTLRSHFLRYLDNPDEANAGFDPLSEGNDDSPWIQLRKDEELRAEILQDVVRCMPENLYFRQPDTQRMLVDILFIFAKLNPDVSYRQGMHELLAPVLWVVERDAIEVGGSSKTMGEDATIKAIFDADHVEHDTFAIFGEVMQSAKNFYEQTSVSGKENPMVARCRRIFDDLLPMVDDKLAKHLQSIDIVPQVFLMRWIRLLFGREFGFDDMLTVWDVIFAEDNTLEIVDHICVAMILRIRWQLIDADYNEALTLLLRYPEVDKDFPPQTLVLDALYLREHLDYHGGSYLVSKYSGRALFREGRPATPPALQRNITTLAGTNAAKPNPSPSPSRVQRPARNIEAVFQSTAKNIYARSERLGIGKAVRSAVDEVHKRAQEIRDAQTPSPPVTWRQRSPRYSTGSDAFQKKIQSLEERSKQLAKLLEGAVSELWEYQKQAAERGQNAEKGDQTEVEQLSLAIAKVQFVQVYLDDPGLPLPEEANEKGQAQESTTESKDAPDSEDVLFDAQAEAGMDLDTVPEQTTGIEEGRLLEISPEQRAHIAKPHDQLDGLADPSSFEDFTEPSAKNKQHVPQISVRSGEPANVPNTLSTQSSAREALRPRLEQSSLSWMLGDSDSSSQPFGNPSSFHPEMTANKGTLFGETGEGTGARNKDRRDSRRKQKVASEPVTDEVEAFDLGNLRHSKP